MIKRMWDNLFNKQQNCKSSTILSERLEVRTRVSKNANPVLFMIEENIRELLLDKYKEEFTLNELKTTQLTPEYEANAEIQYKDDEPSESGGFARFFKKKKVNSSQVLRNRLEIRIKSNNEADDIFNRIKKDVNQLIYEMTESEASKVIVEKDFCKSGHSETIKILISLE